MAEQKADETLHGHA